MPIANINEKVRKNMGLPPKERNCYEFYHQLERSLDNVRFKGEYLKDKQLKEQKYNWIEKQINILNKRKKIHPASFENFASKVFEIILTAKLADIEFIRNNYIECSRLLKDCLESC